MPESVAENKLNYSKPKTKDTDPHVSQWGYDDPYPNYVHVLDKEKLAAMPCRSGRPCDNY